jgi:hypothetical protein
VDELNKYYSVAKLLSSVEMLLSPKDWDRVFITFNLYINEKGNVGVMGTDTKVTGSRFDQAEFSTNKGIRAEIRKELEKIIRKQPDKYSSNDMKLAKRAIDDLSNTDS